MMLAKTRASSLSMAMGAYTRDPSTHNARRVAHELDANGDEELMASVAVELMRCPTLAPEDIADAVHRAIIRGMRRTG